MTTILTNSEYENLIMDLSGDATLGGDVTIDGGNVLTFTQGNIITTEAYKVIIESGASISRTSGHVRGNLQKEIDLAEAKEGGLSLERLWDMKKATFFYERYLTDQDQRKLEHSKKLLEKKL